MATAQLEPIPARKPRKSTKPPAIKASVITRRVQGQSKRSIARDLHITANTVDTILEESQIDSHLESGQRLSVTLIPEAIRVAKHRLSQNSENMAIKVLENTIWPLNNVKRSGMADNIGLTVAIQQLIMPNTTTNSVPALEQAPIEAKSLPVNES